MSKIKILIVAGDMNVGGIENQLMHLLRQADKTKFQIDFTTTCDNPFYKEEIESLGGKCIQIPKTKGKHFLKYCASLYKVIKKGNYDVVHSHELFHSGMVLLTARMAGVKCRFVHAHNWSDGVEKKSFIRKLYNAVMQRLIINNATQFLACSSLAGQFLYGENICRSENYHLVFNSVDTQKFIDNYYAEDEIFHDNWINVIQIGRFTEVKNQLFSVDIANELKKRDDRIRIICVGNNGNEYEKNVIEKVKSLQLEDHFILLGIRKDIDSLMRNSKAFLLPSLFEGMPLVMIEAQASGLPCVTADTYSHEVDFNLGNVFWLSLNEGAGKWADYIEKAVALERPAKEKVQSVIEEKKFDSRMFAETLCDLYEQDYKRRVVND